MKLIGLTALLHGSDGDHGLGLRVAWEQRYVSSFGNREDVHAVTHRQAPK